MMYIRNIKSQFTETGVVGTPGPPALRPVEKEELNVMSGSVTLLLRPMEAYIVRGNQWRRGLATTKDVAPTLGKNLNKIAMDILID